MTLMIPETMVNDLFQCTAARMDGDIIKLIKGQKTCEIDIQKNRVRTDDGWTEARIAEQVGMAISVFLRTILQIILIMIISGMMKITTMLATPEE